MFKLTNYDISLTLLIFSAVVLSTCGQIISVEVKQHSGDELPDYEKTYYSTYDGNDLPISIGWIVAIGIVLLILIIGLPILLCFCCACCCFKAMGSNNKAPASHVIYAPNYPGQGQPYNPQQNQSPYPGGPIYNGQAYGNQQQTQPPTANNATGYAHGNQGSPSTNAAGQAYNNQKQSNISRQEYGNYRLPNVSVVGQANKNQNQGLPAGVSGEAYGSQKQPYAVGQTFGNQQQMQPTNKTGQALPYGFQQYN